MRGIQTTIAVLLAICIIMGCTASDGSGKKKKVKVANIDLSHWKVTIPKARKNGKVIEVSPPGIKDYGINNVLKPYMYNDSTDGSIVFYASPMASTANSSYSRSELREQMMPGKNNVNWTFEQGGRMKGRLSVPEISKDEKGKTHKTIVMQIHGRLSNAQRDLIGQKDNNAPPILKIYWDKGKVRVKTKILKDRKMEGTDLLKKSAWGDDKGFNFDQEVGTKPFWLEVEVSKGKMKITLNNFQSVTYDGIDLEKWGIFENYFKAGNYLQTKDKAGFAKVKYYHLEVSH